MEESSLRLVLLGVGAAILAGIYFYDVIQRKARQRKERPDDFAVVEPVMAKEATFSAVYEDMEKPSDDVAQKEVGSLDTDAESLKANVAVDSLDADLTLPKTNKEVPVAEQALVIQLAVLPKDGECFSGAALLDAFTGLNLEFGDMGIFHCYERQGGTEVKRFHVANILEPGTFPVGNMADFESTGIVLFFQTNDSVDCELAFDSMLNAAKQLSQQFDAMLAGGDMKELTMGGISDIQSQLADLSRL